MSSIRVKNNAGFTFIELIIVIVIIGLLAATALPKFLDVTEEAKRASVEGVAGSFATGVLLVRAQWEAEGRPKLSNNHNNNSVVYDGTRFYLMTPTNADVEGALASPGYPVSTSAPGGRLTYNAATMTSSRCLQIWDNMLQNPSYATDNLADLSNGKYKFYVQTENASANDNKQVCRYYLVLSLFRDSNGAYTAPAKNAENVHMSFVYNPYRGTVRQYINMSE